MIASSIVGCSPVAQFKDTGPTLCCTNAPEDKIIWRSKAPHRLPTMKLWMLLPALSAACAAAQAQSMQIDASFPRALHQWNSTGFSADAGAVFGGQSFVGLEWTYFNPKGMTNVPYIGPVPMNETVNLAQLAYRFSLPIDAFGKVGNSERLEFYVGGGIGGGLIRQTLTYPYAIPGYNGSSLNGASETKTEICYEAVAGVQVNLVSNFGVKVGFRYIDSVNNVVLFNADANTDTKVLEAGVTWRF